MADKDRVVQVSIGLFKSQINKVETFLNKNKKYSSVSNFYQTLTDNFFNGEDNWKTKVKNFMAFIGWPLLLCTIMFIVARSTDNVSQELIRKEQLLIIELAELGNLFYLIGFACIGLMIFSVGILYIKMLKER